MEGKWLRLFFSIVFRLSQTNLNSSVTTCDDEMHLKVAYSCHRAIFFQTLKRKLECCPLPVLTEKKG